MKVSVIIPFYNPGKRLIEAVESAIIQPETGEIILVNDGSTDNSSDIASQMCQKYPVVNLLECGINRGSAYARNLGIQSAKYSYIAFLDADDTFLTFRFTTSIAKLNASSPLDPLDAVYGSTINHFESEQLKKEYQTIFGSEADIIYLKPPSNGKYFESLVLGKDGFIHLNALTVKKDLLIQIGGFDECLKQTQDTDLLLRVTLEGKLNALNQDKPLAIRNVYGNNVVFRSKERTESRVLFLKKWIKYSLKQQLPVKVTIHFLRSYLGEHPYAGRGSFSFFKTLIRKSQILIHLLLNIKSND